MIILYKGSFDHSNRLFQNVHFEAFCLEHSLQFYNLSFLDMQGLYGKSNRKIKTILYKIVNRLIKHKIIQTIDFNDPSDFELKSTKLINKRGIKFCSGWYFQVDDLVEKHQLVFKKKYVLKEAYYINTALVKEVKHYKRLGKFLVGIHIRKGDYQTFENGKYYFDDTVYLRVMQEMTEVLKETGKDIIYLLFSDQKITIKPANNVLISKEPWFIDQYIMSQCDYLIGPPSTFTLWASFTGNVKYYHLLCKDDVIRLENFKYCLS